MTAPTPETRVIATPDGRALMLELGGDPGGAPILVHSGTPNSRHLYDGWLRDAEEHGIRLISYDRPGYGGSDPQPGRTVADCAEDVRAIAMALGLPRFALWGWSGGGPHALACAALLPDLVAAVSVLASSAPYGAPDLDYFAGMGEYNVDGIKLYFEDRAAARADTKEDRLAFLESTPDQLRELLKSLVSPVDAAAMVDDLVAWEIRCIRDGLATSDEGWWEDNVADLEPWGFDFASIRVPVQVWQGRHDRFVPFQHGEWLAAHVPGAEAHLSDSDGHQTLVTDRIPEIHRWLTGHLDASSG